MKHLLNDLTEKEKNSIREQHTGGMNVVTKNFSKLINTKSGDVKPLVNEQEEGENMIRIPKEYGGVVMELGKSSTPEEIMDSYNTMVEEGTPLVSYSDGVFYNEDDEEIPVDVVLDELNYSITGGEEDDDTIGPSPKRKKFGDGGESEFFLTDNIKFERFNDRLGLFYQPSKNGGGISLSDEQKEMLINFLSK
jgi:hypothetical protein